MKKALTAGIVLAGVLVVSGSAFAAPKKVPAKPSKTQNQYEKREGFEKRLPPMSRDIGSEQSKPPMPPDGKHPRISGDKRPPMPPRSGDKRPPKSEGKQFKKGTQPRN